MSVDLDVQGQASNNERKSYALRIHPRRELRKVVNEQHRVNTFLLTIIACITQALCKYMAGACPRGARCLIFAW